MGSFFKLLDAMLLLFFFVIALAAPLIDAQTCLSPTLFPDLLLRLKQWYTHQYSDYLISEKPHFYVAIVWLELLFQWPLALFNIYGILASKSWFPSTCLVYGASVSTSMVAILGELLCSGRASDKLIWVYSPFLLFGMVAMLRGLFSVSAGKTAPIMGRRPALGRKKRA